MFVLIGNPSQLLPVGGSELWNSDGESQMDRKGNLLYTTFSSINVMEKTERVDDLDPEAAQFVDFWKCLRDGKCTKEYWRWICECCTRHGMGDGEFCK